MAKKARLKDIMPEEVSVVGKGAVPESDFVVLHKDDEVNGDENEVCKDCLSDECVCVDKSDKKECDSQLDESGIEKALESYTDDVSKLTKSMKGYIAQIAMKLFGDVEIEDVVEKRLASIEEAIGRIEKSNSSACVESSEPVNIGNDKPAEVLKVEKTAVEIAEEILVKEKNDKDLNSVNTLVKVLKELSLEFDEVKRVLKCELGKE